MSSSLYNLFVYDYWFHYLALLLCEIYPLDQELHDKTGFVILVSDCCLTLLMPDHNVTLITETGLMLYVCVCVCVYMSEHVFTRPFCMLAMHHCITLPVMRL